jgi:hypothetical protein
MQEAPESPIALHACFCTGMMLGHVYKWDAPNSMQHITASARLSLKLRERLVYKAFERPSRQTRWPASIKQDGQHHLGCQSSCLSQQLVPRCFGSDMDAPFRFVAMRTGSEKRLLRILGAGWHLLGGILAFYDEAGQAYTA